MLRRTVRIVWTGALAAAVVAPSVVAGQAPARGQARAPAVRTPAVRAPAVRTTPTSAARRPAPGAATVRTRDDRRDDRGSVRDDRGRVRDDRGVVRDDRRSASGDRTVVRDDRGWVPDDRGSFRGNRGVVRDDRGWGRLKSGNDLRLFGFLGINVRWDARDRDDRRRWVLRYDRYDGRHGFYGPIEGWYRPQWAAIRFERDPLRYGPRGLDSGELRRVLGRRVFDRIVRQAPGRRSDFWARVERFGPRGQSITLEIWSGNRFVAAMTDFNRDGWVDDVELNGRVYR